MRVSSGFGAGRTAILVVTAIASLWGCSLIANLSQFDGAKEATEGGAEDAQPGDDVSQTVDTGADVAVGSDASANEAAQPENLVQNPGFENGIAPWTTFIDGTNLPGLAASMVHAHSGSFSGWVSKRTASFQGTVQDIHASTVQGQTYAVSAWAMVGAPADDGGTDATPTTVSAQTVALTAAITCIVDGSSATNYMPLGSATANDQTWVEIIASLTVPFCQLTTLDVYVEGPDPGVDLFVDDVSVTAVP